MPRLELPFFRPNRIGLLHSARDGVANGLGTRYLMSSWTSMRSRFANSFHAWLVGCLRGLAEISGAKLGIGTAVACLSRVSHGRLRELKKAGIIESGWKQIRILHPQEEEHMVAWERVTRRDVLRAIREYDRLGPERFFSEHGFGPTTTYDLVWDERRYPPKAVLGAAYELATGRRLDSGDFEGGKTGAVRVLGRLGFSVEKKIRPAKSR